MKYYIEAYRDDNSEILGNGDGQDVLNVKDFRRTNNYKHLKGLKDCGFPLYKRPAYWAIVNEKGERLEKIINNFHRPISEWKI